MLSYGKTLGSEALPAPKRTRTSNVWDVCLHVFLHVFHNAVGLLEHPATPIPLAFGHFRKPASTLILLFHMRRSNMALPNIIIGPHLKLGATAFPEALTNFRWLWNGRWGGRGCGGVSESGFFHFFIAQALKVEILVKREGVLASIIGRFGGR